MEMIMSTPKTKSDRPDLITQEHGVTTDTTKGSALNFPDPKNEAGDLLCYRNVTTGKVFYPSDGMFSDPNFAPEYLPLEKLKKLVSG